MKLLYGIFAAAMIVAAVRASPTKRERNTVCKREGREERPVAYPRSLPSPPSPYDDREPAYPVSLPSPDEDGGVAYPISRPSPYEISPPGPRSAPSAYSSYARVKRDVVKDETESESSTADNRNRTKITELVQMAKEVDLVFLVDVTGSMSPYIAGVRDSIFDLVNGLVNGTNDTETVTDLRIAFVGYRDYGDENDHFTVLPFTNNVQKFHEFVSATRASGGEDQPEDVLGGIQRSQSLEWAESTRTRLVFHIADAPAHGCEYHYLTSDSYADGDPQGLTAESLFAWYREHDVQYFFGNITSDTDIMIDRFQDAYGQNITAFDVGLSGSRSGGYGGPYYVSHSGAPGPRGPADSIYHSVKAAVEEAVHEKVESHRETSS